MHASLEDLVNALFQAARQGRLAEVLQALGAKANAERVSADRGGAFGTARYWSEIQNISEAAAGYIEQATGHDGIPPL